jgi:hypothetical protein
MNAMYNMRLPASESGKLVPARTREHLRAESEVVAAPVRRKRPANHLSGFARA